VRKKKTREGEEKKERRIQRQLRDVGVNWICSQFVGVKIVEM
jgi:hypothetical protein